jgi:hypothetical protein
MHLARSLLNVGLGAIGGVLGNLIAGWIQQDVWGNVFTSSRLLATVAGFAFVILVLTWIDATASAGQQKPGIHHNIQIGRALIRVLRGANVYGNIQIGPARIEVTGDYPRPHQDNHA